MHSEMHSPSPACRFVPISLTSVENMVGEAVERPWGLWGRTLGSRPVLDTGNLLSASSRQLRRVAVFGRASSLSFFLKF